MSNFDKLIDMVSRLLDGQLVDAGQFELRMEAELFFIREQGSLKETSLDSAVKRLMGVCSDG
jgi:hypothetical protein